MTHETWTRIFSKFRFTFCWYYLLYHICNIPYYKRHSTYDILSTLIVLIISCYYFKYLNFSLCMSLTIIVIFVCESVQLSFRFFVFLFFFCVCVIAGRELSTEKMIFNFWYPWHMDHRCMMKGYKISMCLSCEQWMFKLIKENFP